MNRPVPAVDHACMPQMTPARTIYFGPRGAERFGWLHGPPAGNKARIGVVLCNAHGREEGSVHRTLRQLAISLAAAGVPTLRFDAFGVGNSQPIPYEDDATLRWRTDVDLAINAVRNEAGVSSVCVVAVRSGVLAAALAAMQRDDVSAFVALAPVVSGRTLLREWKALQGASAARPAQGSDASLSVGGYLFGASTCAAISSIDLLAEDRLPAPRILIVDRDDLPTAARWAERLSDQGASTQRELLLGFAAMLLDPHHAVVPTLVLDRVRDWVLRESAVAGVSSSSLPPGEVADRLGLQGGLREGGVWIANAEAPLFGVLTQPSAGVRCTRAVLMVNAGAARHIGPHGWYVPLARRLVEGGTLVLRFDLSGLGDSAARPGRSDHVVYPADATNEIRAAIAFLQHEAGVEQVQLLGLCSGAYHVFKAAVAGAAMASAIMINPLTFFWKAGLSLDSELADHRVVEKVAGYGHAVWQAERWLKLLRGRVNLGLLVRVMGRRASSLLRHRIHAIGRSLGMTLPEDLAGELRVAVGHGVALHFLFAEGDPGLTILREQGGPTVSRLGCQGMLTTEIVRNADHTFSAMASRERLFERIQAAVAGGWRVT